MDKYFDESRVKTWEAHEDEEIKAQYKHFKALKLCLVLLKRIEEDMYYDRFHNKIVNKYGKLKMEFLPPGQEGYKQLKMSYEFEKEGDTEIINKLNHEHADARNRMKKRDSALLFKLLNEHYEYWWD